MKGVLYLAWRYLAYHRFKTAILLLSITLIIYLPVGLHVLVDQSEEQLTSRAKATPLIVGAKGSPLELCLNTLYFESDTPARMTYQEALRVRDSGLARAIPIYNRFKARQHPIVGTSLDYFDFRGLAIEKGNMMTLLGECVVGAQVAEELEVGPGGTIISSPESVFDLAGVYPLQMNVAGVLGFSDSPDDRAIFVDLKTAWVIEGLCHGHQDLARPEASSAVLKREGNKVIGNASVVQYNVITADNLDSFHFHGDRSGFPITAVIAVPPDHKSSTLLMGRYQSPDDPSQITKPLTVMNELLGTILTVQSYVVTAVIIIGISTLATAALVFLLSQRLRRREIETMHKIGGSRGMVTFILGSEIVTVLAAGILFAAGLTLLTSWAGSSLIRNLILS
ncbi:MAG: ABC transporter permease [Planctomycetota bacterium]|jgi:putative ABC transport system permease protein